LRWLNSVGGVCLTQVSLFLIGQQYLVDFFRYQPLLLIGWQIVQFYANAGGQQIQRQLLSVQYCQYKQQANPLLSMNKFTPHAISRNDKKTANHYLANANWH
jgi:hypothetical protein